MTKRIIAILLLIILSLGIISCEMAGQSSNGNGQDKNNNINIPFVKYYNVKFELIL